MRAYKLFNTPDGASAFQQGTIQELEHISSPYFFLVNDEPERRHFDWHPAPRRQYVITLKGSLEFTVTDGSSFVVHPGDVVIALDTAGTGHKWRMLSQDSWSRIYIVLQEDQHDAFLAD
ncbi:hypothetical protein [Dyadobacter psychrotolerans]|uniref:Cupin domain-containing protein n=1 Tax=Dyadobacter psychrotolerans TaxID=2541721 RepID=A0A4R5DRL3_9BACT|nr:hypothetical protein [Dyadobacter psychrotolerans]TDE14701.1 hypothetical protein E0F88_16065 [Dyadobacter psychrotolerans]